MGAPYWDSNVRGILTGITRDTKPENIIRSTLESVAYQTLDLFDQNFDVFWSKFGLWWSKYGLFWSKFGFVDQNLDLLDQTLDLFEKRSV